MHLTESVVSPTQLLYVLLEIILLSFAQKFVMSLSWSSSLLSLSSWLSSSSLLLLLLLLLPLLLLLLLQNS